jgi:hypothetical protein
MNRSLAAVCVALAAPLAAPLAAMALHTGAAIAPTFGAFLVAAFVIERPR